MDLGAAGLHDQPFRTHGRPLATVSYAARREALKHLEESCTHIKGLCLLQGPPLSGKSTLVREFADRIPEERAVAVIKGDGLDATGLLDGVLEQFGYALEHGSVNELLAMVRVFAMQQAVAHGPPVIVIEDAQAVSADALRAIADLAGLTIRGAGALRMVLVGNRSLRPFFQAQATARIAERVSHDVHLHPMTSAEAREYVHAKLRAAGCDTPETVFPRAICNELWRASGGWPGILDRIALLALAKSDSLPIPAAVIERPALPDGTWLETDGPGDPESPRHGREPPRLFVTLNGQTLHDLALDQPRLMIGRSEHNDVAITSKFISRHHVLLVRHGATTLLMDLNSTNGTFVNAKRVSNHILLDNDVITIGHHRIKFSDPRATRQASMSGVDFTDTSIMKTLDDVRRLLLQDDTTSLPILTENLPTTGL
jgi:type II secretory pathway predicted ATPase ExeA